MPFNSELPEWNKAATAPTTTKKNAGWGQDEKPPASIFNWFFYTTFKALQELQLEAINTDQKGIANGVAPLDASGKVPTANLPGQNAFANVAGKTGGMLSNVVADSPSDQLIIEGQGLIQVSADPSTDTITINTTAEVNQNAFSQVNVNGALVTADYKSDQLNMFPGTGMSVVADSPNNKITIGLENTTWMDLTLQNGAQIHSDVAQYRKVGGVVYLRGAVKNVLNFPTTIATLPVGFRPTGTSHAYSPPSSLESGGQPTNSRIQIGTDGTIKIEGKTGSAPVSLTWYPIHTCFPVD